MVNSTWYYNPATHVRRIKIADLDIDTSWLNITSQQTYTTFDSGRLKFDDETLRDVAKKEQFDDMVTVFQKLGAYLTMVKNKIVEDGQEAAAEFKFDIDIELLDRKTQAVVSSSTLQGCLIVDAYMSSELVSEQVKYEASVVYQNWTHNDS